MSKCKVLVAEDSEFSQLIIEQILFNIGYSYVIVNNGIKVIELLKKNELFNLIIMDIEMPDMDGITTVKKIRAEFGSKINSIPVLALTAHTNKDYLTYLSENGFNDCITKPIAIDAFEIKLSMYCKELIPTACLTFEEETDKLLYDPNLLIRNANGDTEFMKNLIKLFIRKSPDALNEMKDALATNDLNILKEKANALSVQFFYLGAKKLADCTMLIEEHAAKNKYISEIKRYIDAIEKQLYKLISQLNTDFLV